MEERRRREALRWKRRAQDKDRYNAALMRGTGDKRRAKPVSASDADAKDKEKGRILAYYARQ